MSRYPALTRFLEHSDVGYHSLAPARAEGVNVALLRWYAANRRFLPWRGDAPPYNGSTAGANRPAATAAGTPPRRRRSGLAPVPTSAYGVWVSEIMCQQTRVEAVVPYWLAWMEAFPTVAALAAATPEQASPLG